MSLLEMSFSGAVMILVIILIRALFLYHLPKKTFLVLWGIALIRLLVPYSLSSAFSIYTLLESPLSLTGIKPVQTGVWMVQQSDFIALDTTASGISAAKAAFPAVSLNQLVWLAGMSVCILFFAAASLKYYRRFQEALPAESSFASNWLKEHRLYRKIRLKQSDQIFAPLTYGIFFPVILLPKHINWKDTAALSYILAHEYIHIRRFEAAAKMILALAVCMHWFNPVVWVLYFLANRDLELSCDEAVLRLLGEQKKSAYALMLIQMEEKRSALAPLCSNFSKQAIEERIKAIMKTKKTSWLSIMAAVLVAGIALAFATSRQSVIQEESQNNTFSYQDISERDRSNAKLIANSRWFSDYAKYGLSYDPKQEILFYNGQPVSFFHDETQPGVYTHLSFSQGTAGIEVKRNEDWEIIGLIEYSTSLTDEIVQEETREQSAESKMDSAATSTDFQKPAQKELLAEYEKFGIFFDDSGHMLYQNKPVRWFADFAELENGHLASRYVYRNDQGSEDIRTIRSRIDHRDSSTDPFGSLCGIVPWKIEDFDDLDFLFKDSQSQETSETITSESTASKNTTGLTFAKYFSRYKDFGLTYVEAEGISGGGNVYLNDVLVSRFADNAPDGRAFSFTSAKTGGMRAQTEYDNRGNLIAIKEILPDSLCQTGKVQ